MQASNPYQLKWIQMQGEVYELKRTVKEKAIVILAKRDCCMSLVIKHLLQGLGVNPPEIEVDDKDESRVIDELELIVAGEGTNYTGRIEFPVVFIGGQLFGGLERVMATHIHGELIPILKNAGALWL